MTAALPLHPLNLLHPRTGEPLRALGYTKRGAPIWPVLGGSESQGEPNEGGQQSVKPSPKPGPALKPSDDGNGSQGAAEGAHGYPEGVAVAEMTMPQQLAYFRTKARREEDTRKSAQQERDTARSERDAFKPKADQYDQLLDSTKSEQERAVENAKSEAAKAARAEERTKGSLALVGAEFRAAAKGVLTADALAGLLEDIDRSRYVRDDGSVDLERIEKRVADLAPPKQERERVDLGAGNRGGTKPSDLDVGRDLYAQRHPKKAAGGTKT